MDRLPVEIIEIILSLKKLNINDIINFSSTCHYLRDIVLISNNIWKNKYRQKWPEFYSFRRDVVKDWLEEIKHVYELKEDARRLLVDMPQKFYTKNELSDNDYVQWSELINADDFNYEYVVNDLIDMVSDTSSICTDQVVDLLTPGNRTLHYYAYKVLRYVRHYRLSEEWKKFTQLPHERQTLELAATIVAQWFQPDKNITHKEISKIFDNLAEEVRNNLYARKPNHPLFSVPKETLEKWKITNLKCNQYNTAHSKEVLTSMKYILSIKIGFCGNTSNYYLPENSYINEVLSTKRGLPITLSIVYESVGRRLGLNCEPVNTPAHFLLRYTEEIDSRPHAFYIDVFNKGEIIRAGSCAFSHFGQGQEPRYSRATALEVVERMTNNLEVALRDRQTTHGGVALMRSVLEFHVLIQPDDLTTIVYLARLYMTCDMDTSKLENLILSRNFENPEQANRVLNMLRGYEAHVQYNRFMATEPEPVKRHPTVKFAVGMVMKHKLFNYICVICDWHPLCMETLDWQIHMNVDKLKFGAKQPFYSCLVEDGSKRYVAQENLDPTSHIGSLYLNEDIGRHFSHFYQTHYVPNAEKEKQYPEDRAVRHKFHIKLLTDDSSNFYN